MLRRTSSAWARLTPVVSATMSSTCSWKTTTPSVSSSAGTRLGWRKRRSRQPCRLSRNGVIMSDFTGPGRNSEMSTMRSSNAVGPSLPTSSRWPGLSIWNIPRVRVVRISSKVSGSSSGTCASSSRSTRSPVTRSTSATACAIEDCIRMPRTSSLRNPRVSTSSLSNWLIGKPSQLASTGVRSSIPALDRTTPHGCSAMCRGRPSRASTRSKNCASRGLSRPRLRSSGRSAMAWRASRARMCGNALAISSTSTGGIPSAAPTSRTAWRTL